MSSPHLGVKGGGSASSKPAPGEKEMLFSPRHHLVRSPPKKRSRPQTKTQSQPQSNNLKAWCTATEGVNESVLSTAHSSVPNEDVAGGSQSTVATVDQIADDLLNQPSPQVKATIESEPPTGGATYEDRDNDQSLTVATGQVREGLSDSTEPRSISLADIRDRLGTIVRKSLKTTKPDLKVELESLMVDMDLLLHRTSTATQCTQEGIRNETATLIVRKHFNNPDKIHEILALKWPPATYAATTIARGGFFKKTRNTTRIILCPADKIDGCPLLQKLTQSHPLIKLINQESLPAGNIARINCGDEIVMAGCDDSEGRQEIIVGSLKSPAPEDVRAMILQILEAVGETKANRLSIAADTSIETDSVRKLVEIALSETDTSAVISVPRGQLTRPVKAKAPRPESLLVHPESMSYADLVKKIKTSISPEEFKGQIISAKKNGSGDLELKLKGTAASLQSAISEKVPGVSIVRKQPKTVMHLNYLEEDVTEQEIVEGIAAAAGVGTEDISVTSIRSAYNNTANATVKVPAEHATTLHKTGRVQIGLVYAKVKIREERPRCFRCWQEGHTAEKCTGQDKRGLCFRCEKPGHSKYQCKAGVGPNHA